MKCPRTNEPLTIIKVGGIELDVSKGCGGVWFDNFEIDKFTSANSDHGKVLVKHLKQFHKPLSDEGTRLNCPKDTDVVMMRRFFSGKQQIEIDECPACGGIWLDVAELDQIHEIFPREGDYESAQRNFVDNVIRSNKISIHQNEYDIYIEKINFVGKFLRFITTRESW